MRSGSGSHHHRPAWARRAAIACGALLAVAGAWGPGAWAAAGEVGTAQATLHDLAGKEVGHATLRETPHGVLLHVRLDGVPAGEHAFHIHQTGACTPPFKSAGGHFAPDGHAHGFSNPAGAHAGDLPNVFVPESGKLEFEVLAPRTSLSDGAYDLLDADGSALVIHRGADDYRTDPAGNAGERIACGVIRKGG